MRMVKMKPKPMDLETAMQILPRQVGQASGDANGKSKHPVQDLVGINWSFAEQKSTCSGISSGMIFSA